MTVEWRHEHPYPRDLRSLADIEKYLKSLHMSLMSAQSTAPEVTYTEIVNNIQNNVVGTTNQVIVTATGDTAVLSTPQDTHTGASPTFVTAKLSGLTDGYVPYHVADATGLADSPIYTDGVATVDLRNDTDDLTDVMLRFVMGATPLVKWSMGLDVTDANKFKLASGDEFGNSHDVLQVAAYDGSTAGVSEFTVVTTFTDATASRGGCTDGLYLYYADNFNKQIVKIDIVTGVEITRSAVITGGDLRKMAYGNDYVYVVNYDSSKIRKYLADDLSYIGQTDYWYGVTGLCYWGGFLYACNDNDHDVKKIRCSDLAVIWTAAFANGDGDSEFDNANGITTDGVYLYVLDAHAGNNRIARLDIEDGAWVDATVVATTFDALSYAIWIAGDWLYVLTDHGTNDVYAEKYLRADMTLAESFAIAPDAVYQGFQYGDYHYLMSSTATAKIYKYWFTSSASYAGSGFTFRLPDEYGQVRDLMKLTAAGNLGIGTISPDEKLEAVGNIQATLGQFISTVPVGTAPLSVVSTTLCANLNADMLDGYHAASFTLLPADPGADRILFWDDSETAVAFLACGDSIAITATTLDTIQDIRTSAGPSFDHVHTTVATGTAPFVVASTTAVSNLNADLLDGVHYTGFPQLTIQATATPGVDDDIDNYREGTIWIEQDANKAYVCVDNADGAAVWQEIGAGGGAFTDLSDVDSDYTGDGGKFVKVKATEDGLEYVASSVAAHDLNSATHGDTNLGTPGAGEDGYAVVWDNGTSKYILAAVAGGGAHALLSATHSDTLADTVIRGDVMIGNSTPKWSRLAKGAANQVLGGDGTDSQWVTACPTAGKYIVQEAHADLSAEQSLGALTTGLLKNTVAASVGTLSTATAGQDYSKHCWIHETFDGLATGSILGLGSYFEAGAWADDTLAAGSTAEVTVKAGADKMLTITNNAAAGITTSGVSSHLTTAIGCSGGARLHFKFKINQDAAGYYGNVDITDTADTQMARFYMRNSTGWKISFNNGTTTTNLQAAAKDTWYTVDAIWGPHASNSITIFIDGTYSAKLTVGNATTKWDRIWIGCTSPAGGADCVLDVDDLYFYSLFPLGLD